MKNFLILSLVIIFATGMSGYSTNPYFVGEAIDPNLLTTPIEKDNAIFKQEIEDIIKMQSKASNEQIKKAEDEIKITPEMVAQEIDPQFTRVNYPKSYNLLDRVGATSKEVTDNAKNYWNTKRPYLIDKRIKSLIKAHSNPAYPSGHTSASYSFAHTLSMLVPEQKERFLKRAEEIATHRVLVGMHFPHDITGGKELSLLIIGGLLQNVEFQQDLESARMEIKARNKK